MDTQLPRVLVVSNNPFSDYNCNGKTLASFFNGWDKDCIANLFFSDMPAAGDACLNFYKLSDVDMLRKSFGTAVKPQESVVSDSEDITAVSLANRLKNLQVVRLLRECIWRENIWRNHLLLRWLDEFSPQIVFFMGGDSIFAYRISHYIAQRYNCRYVLYITDDYFLPRFSLSPFYWLRFGLIRRCFKQALKRQDLFITISEKMQKVYNDIFGFKSIYISNIAEDFSVEDTQYASFKFPVVLVYAGSFSFGRDKTISLIAKACSQINNERGEPQLRLEVYSSSEPRYELNYVGTSRFNGFETADKIKKILADADVLVFAESFSCSSINSVRLSLSTKVSEYASIRKCILNVGPLKANSVEYLKNVSVNCNSPHLNDIKGVLESQILDAEIREKCADAAYNLYRENHMSQKLRSKFRGLLKNLVQEV